MIGDWPAVLQSVEVRAWAQILATPASMVAVWGWLARRQLAHEKDDADRFVDIDLRANAPQEALMGAVTGHANQVTAILTPMQVKVEALYELRHERRSTTRTSVVD